MEREKYTSKQFAQALAEIMREKYGDRLGNFDVRPVLSQVEGYSYEALRLMLKGKRSLTLEAIEGIAKVVGVSPHYFAEYRLMWPVVMARKYPPLAEDMYQLARRFVEAEEGVESIEGVGDGEGTESSPSI